MEFARKLLLVPADREQQFAEEHLSELDQQMQKILSEKNSQDEKAKRYLQVLQKYVTFSDIKSQESASEVNEIHQDDTLAVEKDVVLSAPVKYKTVATKILEFIKMHKEVVSWTSSKELKIKGQVIPNTDVVAVINFILRQQKTAPRGFEEVKKVFQEIQFPDNFVKNKHISMRKEVKDKNVIVEKSLYAKPNFVKKKMKSFVWQKL